MDGDALLAQAEAMVRQAQHIGADEAEVFLTHGRSIDLELENGALAMSGASRVAGGSIRIVQEGRLGFAYFTDPADAPSATRQALAMSRLAPKKSFHLPEPTGQATLPSRWDDRLANMPVADALDLADGLVQGVTETCPDAVLSGGGVGVGASMEAIASSTGVAVWDRDTDLSIGASLVLGESGAAVSHWDHAQSHHLDLDPHALGTRTADTVASLRDPQDADRSGPSTVLFRAAAVAELIDSLVGRAVLGDDAMRGKTMWSDRLGKTVAGEGVHIDDDPLCPGALGVGPFDGEGMRAERRPLVQGGTLQAFLFDAWDAADHDQTGTHSATRGGFKSKPSTGVQHLHVWHDDQRDEAGMLDMDGYIVGSVLGAHTANATTGEFSITAPNVWRVQDGDVKGACGEIAIAGSLDGLLRSMDASARSERHLGGITLGDLRFADVHVSS